MLPASLICPQCGAPLPRHAAWRYVVCAYCKAEVTKREDMVHASVFQEAHQRALAAAALEGGNLVCGGQRYKLLMPLGHGTTGKVTLAQRTGCLPQRVAIKLVPASDAADRLEREFSVLKQLQADQSRGAAYFSQRLPQPVACGIAEESGHRQHALVLRNAPGFWGSLADVKRHYPLGIDPRHAVWMWRRVLEVLDYLHQIGWVHGRLSPDHQLVHPQDHGILLIGWADAHKFASRSGKHGTPACDLMQSAWTIRTMLAGGDDEPAIPASVPSSLTALLKSTSEDIDWCAKRGASGIDEALKAAARADFGPPQFIHFTPTPQG